jgi:hypothetical protein
MLFLFIFGIVIMTVESDGDTISSSLKANIIKCETPSPPPLNRT